MGLGRFNEPKPGLFPFLIGILLGGISLFKFLTYFSLKGKDDHLPVAIPLKRIFPLTVCLFLYTLFIYLLGFNISTFLLVFLLLVLLESKSWTYAMLISSTMVFCVHFIFKTWFKIPLPTGILGF
jgi:hypothetical protein